MYERERKRVSGDYFISSLCEKFAFEKFSLSLNNEGYYKTWTYKFKFFSLSAVNECGCSVYMREYFSIKIYIGLYLISRFFLKVFF